MEEALLELVFGGWALLAGFTKLFAQDLLRRGSC
jgi:hypothetical protein